MKFSIKSLAGMCACAVLAFALLAHADQGVETSASASGTPPQVGGRGPGNNNSNGAPLRRAFKAAENRMHDNKDVRNKILRDEQPGLAGERKEIRKDLYTNVSEIRGDIKDDRKEFRKGGVATSGPERAAFRAQVKAERNQIKSLRKAAAIELKDNRGKQLTNAGLLLEGAESRLTSFIAKASSTKDTSEAASLLATAHIAIVKAKADIAAFVAWKPVTVENASGTDPEVDITKPRQLFETAKASIFAARAALRKTALSLGFGAGIAEGKGKGPAGMVNASSTATTTIQN